MYIEGTNGRNVLVADGLKWPTVPGMKVHGADLESGFARVGVEIVKKAHRNVALPVPTEEFKTLGQTEWSTI